MPSLFVWKATSPLTTSSSVSYYSGSDWFLEEHSTYSKSAMFLNQRALSNQGCVYDIKWMPTNWVGSHLLENVSVPYALIKEDVVGRLEQWGDWMRFTSYHEVDDKEAEWERIQQWVLTNTVKKELAKPFVSSTSYEPCLINLSVGHSPVHSPVSYRNDSKFNKNHHKVRYPQYHTHHSHHSHQKKMIVA